MESVNWTFLGTLSAAAVVFFHACELLRDMADQAVARDWYDKWRRILRDDPKCVDKAVQALGYLRDTAKY